jgi:flagellin FlaB
MAGNLRKFAWQNKKKGTIGIGTLIVFIALVLVAAIASAVILKTAYSLKDAAEATGHATVQEVSGGIKVLDIVGDRNLNKNGVPVNVQTGIQRITFLVTVWAGSQGINMRTMRVHWMGPTQSAYLTINPASYTAGSGTDFGCDNVPSAVTNDWNPPGVMYLQWENMVYVELELGNGNIGEQTGNPASWGLVPGSHAAVYFEPAAGLVVEESFTTPTTYGSNQFIDLTMQ